ncbi:MAG: hypothetical protein DRR19_20700, partial [Candidatus Parabeggiatoa sp. nov. 1]
FTQSVNAIFKWLHNFFLITITSIEVQINSFTDSIPLDGMLSVMACEIEGLFIFLYRKVQEYFAPFVRNRA